ncbi:MAG: methylated-DNA--[protein]-cysteine S-methyltransferase [Gemmatimonadales bacterium]|nr:methylated-DNA--[protein]-cysteine S-methyltransferase [Gemmatimonadales bacterium]NIR01220.1 methylated-DNA--[protein]-cysteine S-methyltransferase [Gemmatimonadales bacterium]NIS65243.1 methylated-DNA--[protein]-cysteine S-methyltransferase [Gemmatimonadales bacterium]
MRNYHRVSSKIRFLESRKAVNTGPQSIRDYRRIEAVIRFLEGNAGRQPSLQQTAAAVDLSEFHLQRLFRRWAGVSPKRFLQFLTVQHAKEALREGLSVLATAYETGLSGPGRLHDLFVAVEAVTPGEYKDFGEDVEIRYGFAPSPFGDCLIAATGRGVCGLEFVMDGDRVAPVERLEGAWPGARLVEDRATAASYVNRIFAPAAGRTEPVTLLLKGTNFQLKVWRALLQIPPGAATSYGALAEAIRQPSAARAVGNAVAKNPIAYLIPCHRVLRESGAFGGYRWGGARKQAMLGWEAARRVG